MIIGLCSKSDSKESNTDERFARAEYFVLYNTENSEYKFLKNTDSGEHGAGPKAVQFFSDNGCNVIIAPRLGENAVKAAKASGIELKLQNDGTVEENIKDFLKK